MSPLGASLEIIAMDLDSDGDGYSDGVEAAAMTNQYDAGSFPPLPVPIVSWPLAPLLLGVLLVAIRRRQSR